MAENVADVDTGHVEDGMIAPRATNGVQFGAGTVLKTSVDRAQIAGQLWFYRQLRRRCSRALRDRPAAALAQHRVACNLFPRLLNFSMGTIIRASSESATHTLATAAVASAGRAGHRSRQWSMK